MEIKDTPFERKPLPNGEQLPIGWFAISFRFWPESSTRKKQRNRWYTISSSHGKVYRVLRFAATFTKGNDSDPAIIAMDYQGWWELQGLRDQEDTPLQLSIRPISLTEWIPAINRHPDPTQRLALRLALLSVGLGLIGLFIGVLAA